MRTELKHQEKIELYLLGLLSDQDKLLFESEMQQNEMLANEVLWQKKLQDGIGLMAFKQEIAQVHAAFLKQNKPFWKKGWFGLGSLAVIGLAGALSYLSYAQSHLKTDEDKETVVLTPEVKPEATQDTLIGNVLPSDTDCKTAQKTTKGIPIPAPDFWKINLPKFSVQTGLAQDTIHVRLPLSGSVVTIPANSLCFADGKPVSGEVEIRMKEYRNQADIAFSGLPMHYFEKGDDFHMSSAGMFEIRAFQGYNELKLKDKSDYVVNYQLTQLVDSVYLFALDDATRQWQKKQLLTNISQVGIGIPVDMVKENKGKVTVPRLNANEGALIGIINGQSANSIRISDAQSGNSCLHLYDSSGNELVFNTVLTAEGYCGWKIPAGTYRGSLTATGFETIDFPEVIIAPGKFTELSAMMRPISKPKTFSFWQKIKQNFRFRKKQPVEPIYYQQLTNVARDIPANYPPPYWYNGTVYQAFPYDEKVAKRYPEGSEVKVEATKLQVAVTPLSAAQQSLMNVSQQLRLEGFGVYNCDQYSRLKNPIAVEARWFDESGHTVLQQGTLTIFDLRFNNAFMVYSGAPIQLSKDGRHCLLLTTYDNKIYFLSEAEFEKLRPSLSSRMKFNMREVTAEMKSEGDLKKLLQLP